MLTLAIARRLHMGQIVSAEALLLSVDASSATPLLVICFLARRYFISGLMSGVVKAWSGRSLQHNHLVS